MRMYKKIENEYGSLLNKHLPHYSILLKKWQDIDLRWPHSDLDFRIILQGNDIDWIETNIACYNIHYDLVSSQERWKRILEHTAGYIFLEKEINQNIVITAEFLTWSYSHGNQSLFNIWKNNYQTNTWSSSDESLYHNLISNRLGCYNLEKDSTDNIISDTLDYQLHCLCWHYFTTVRFAQLAINHRSFLTGKRDISRYDNYSISFFKNLLSTQNCDLLQLSSIIEACLGTCTK